MELGVFWLLAEKNLPVDEIAQSLGIARNRCHYWLQVLFRLGLLDEAAKAMALLCPIYWYSCIINTKFLQQNTYIVLY